MVADGVVEDEAIGGAIKTKDLLSVYQFFKATVHCSKMDGRIDMTPLTNSPGGSTGPEGS